jgi:hypothetical protein
MTAEEAGIRKSSGSQCSAWPDTPGPANSGSFAQGRSIFSHRRFSPSEIDDVPEKKRDPAKVVPLRVTKAVKVTLMLRAYLIFMMLALATARMRSI